MKSWPIYLLLSLILMSVPIYLGAQSQQYIDRITLNDKSVFEGTIIAYKTDESLTLELRGGSKLTIELAEVKRIEQLPDVGKRNTNRKLPRIGKAEGAGLPIGLKKTYDFRERGLYNVNYFGMMAGSSPLANETQIGVQVASVVGYQFNRKLGIGGGLGLMSFNLGEGESVYPVFAEVRGYLREKIVSPYYVLSAGYSFAFKDESNRILEAKGGLMLYPAVGFRLTGAKATNFLLDIGYLFQNVEYLRQSPVFGDFEEQKIRYKRLVIRMSLLF